MIPSFRWGRAYFVQMGDVPWTEADAIGFIGRVDEVIRIEREKVRRPVLALVLDETEHTP